MVRGQMVANGKELAVRAQVLLPWLSGDFSMIVFCMRQQATGEQGMLENLDKPAYTGSQGKPS